ncbi:ferredoxin [Actinocorallia longicatena]|uniref:Ferredoxin n=1 Tax=Actinocorallia longicatena TaxID=111803 RepID=A0ABP6Q5J7_9ACTN
MTHLTADREACRGAGQCTRLAPALFDQDDDTGLVVLLTDSPTEAQLPTARHAASFCPTGAITLSPP